MVKEQDQNRYLRHATVRNINWAVKISMNNLKAQIYFHVLILKFYFYLPRTMSDIRLKIILIRPFAWKLNVEINNKQFCVFVCVCVSFMINRTNKVVTYIL